jgi:hypothetical protein
MRAALEQEGLSDDDRLHLNFALGKALEDAGEDEDAFARYAEGNGFAPRRCVTIRTPSLPRRGQRGAVHGQLPRRRVRITACPRPDPIFILGMPRAGSTLVEQILSSHPEIEAQPNCPTSSPSFASSTPGDIQKEDWASATRHARQPAR